MKPVSCKFMFLFIILIFFCSLNICPQSSASPGEVIDDRVNKAVEWLIAAQNSDGSWGNYIKKDIFNTAEITGYLDEAGRAPASVSEAVYWLQGQEGGNYDFRARLLPFIKEQEKHEKALSSLISGQNASGGWGMAKGYDSDILDTVIVLKALLRDSKANNQVIKDGLSYILKNQNDNGSWSYKKNAPGNVFLTARVVLMLNTYTVKTGEIPGEVAIALQKAGDYLTAQELTAKDKYANPEQITGTLAAYRAVLQTTGFNAPGAVVDNILSVQASDGSWHNDEYVTLLAIQALEESQNLSGADIDSITLFNESNEESYSFNAYEPVIMQVDGQYDTEESRLSVFVKKPGGSLVTAESDGQYSWNTESNAPGEYHVIARLKDKETGLILASKKQSFSIEPEFKINNVIVENTPKSARVDEAVQVSVNVSLINQSNIDGEVKARIEVFDAQGAELKSVNETVYCSAGEQIVNFNPLVFTPDSTTESKYTVKASIYHNGEQVNSGQSPFEVLPPPPPVRISPEQSLDKKLLYPGNDSVTANFTLTGEGTPEVPQRDPVDLVLAIDDSGSMEWGNSDYSNTRPNRLDYAKEASKQIIDMLQPEDRGAVVEFAGSVWVQQDLTGDKELLKTRIDQTPPSPWDGTAIGKGIRESIEVLDEKSGPGRDKVIVLLTDGGDNRWSYWRVVYQAMIAQQKGYKIYTIGLGSGAHQGLLKTIASTAGGSYVFSPTMEQLNEMMTVLAGEILDTAGEDITFSTTIPGNGMTFDAESISPQPGELIDQEDGSVRLKWNFDRLVMGQEKNIAVDFTGTGLESGTTVTLTTATKLSYLDKNGTRVTVELPELRIPVNRYSIDTLVSTDREEYGRNDSMEVTVKAENPGQRECKLTGRVEITDRDGKTVGVVEPGKEINLKAGASETFTCRWNTGDVLAGTYKVKVIWSEGDTVISSVETPFEIVAAGAVANSVYTDKTSYRANETVNIEETVKNNSPNGIESNLSVNTRIRNSAGDIVWSKDTAVPELTPGESFRYNNHWEIGQSGPGEYTVVAAVYRNSKVASSDSTRFDINPSYETGQGLSGKLKVLDESIYPADPLQLEYSLTNTGNTKVPRVQARIRIVNPETEKVVDSMGHRVDLDINQNISPTMTWEHPPLETGNYMVVYDAAPENGNSVPLGSGYFTVEKPFTTSVQQVVRPRVLVWAESSSNINLAGDVLDKMQVYHTLVNTRDEFMSQLKTGRYNVYMLLDSKRPLTGHDDRELAAEIAEGKGIIAARDANGDNLKNLGLFGVKFKGHNPPRDYTVNFKPDSPFADVSLEGTGKAQFVELAGGDVQAVLSSKKGNSPGVILNRYQEGQALLFTFDPGSSEGNVPGILRKAVELTVPGEESSSNVAEIEVKVTAKGAVKARLKQVLPEGTRLLWSKPELAQGCLWDFNTSPGEEYTYRYILEMPGGVAGLKLISESYYRAAGEYFQFESTGTEINS